MADRRVPRVRGGSGLEVADGAAVARSPGRVEPRDILTYHRSSRLSLQYRVVYRIEGQRLYIEVVSVTGHDYRRK
jgi:hypothetical protein